MKNAMIDLNLLPRETLAEMANEAAEQAEKNAKVTVQKAIDAGRYLIAAKEQSEPGEWLTWLGANWNYHQTTASRYMRVASRLSTMLNLADAKNINEALRMIGEAEPETAPRTERKIGQVEVVEPGQTAVQADDDPTPDPPTNRKTAKGSEKVSEDKKPQTVAVTPELLPDEDEEPDPIDDWMGCRSLEDVALRWLGDTQDVTAKKSAAKHLRKLADKLDPPTKFVKPTMEEVAEYCSERKNSVDPEAFMAHYNANGWKQSNGNKCCDWKGAVITWEKRDASNGKANGNGRRTTATQDPASCLGANGRPEIKHRKINYK